MNTKSKDNRQDWSLTKTTILIDHLFSFFQTINGEISIEATNITELFSNKPKEAKILFKSPVICLLNLIISYLAKVTRITKSNVIEV